MRRRSSPTCTAEQPLRRLREERDCRCIAKTPITRPRRGRRVGARPLQGGPSRRHCGRPTPLCVAALWRRHYREGGAVGLAAALFTNLLEGGGLRSLGQKNYIIPFSRLLLSPQT